jgi:Ni/Fe-hydrogenase subunit HybB-like protein
MSMADSIQEKRRFSTAHIVLAAVAGVGLLLAIIRLVQGLGATTNLNDSYPWGLWIVFDCFAVPFSGGAFTLALVTQIFNRKRYQEIAHLALLAGFLGYALLIMVLLLDINRWDQFWSVLLPWRWNLHSFMFEVSLSITLYFGVLILELLPIAAGTREWLAARLVSRLIVLIAAVGVLLSTVHQGSFGALFIVLHHRLHELWWTPIIPVLFFTSSLFSGFSIAILAAIWSWRALKRPVPMKLVSGLARMAAVVLAIYLALKIGDLLFAGELGRVFDSGAFSLVWLAEMIIGVVIPLVIFVSPARESENGLLLGAFFALVGLAINRSTVAWFGLGAPHGATYSPSWIEYVITIAAFATGFLFFALGVRSLRGLREPIIEGGH